MIRALALACLLASGCVTVKPYEREQLAHPGMRLDDRGDPDAAAEVHMLESREGAAGGQGGVGGGCGCD